MTLEAVDNPGWEDVIELAIRRYVRSLRTGFPAVVVAYDHDPPRASVRPVVRSRRVNGETFEVETYLPPVIANVPVGFEATPNGGLTFPLERGDFVFVECAERSMDEWKMGGGTDATPRHTRRFDISDAVIVTKIRPFNDPLPATALDAAATVLFGDEVKLGDSTASAFVALANLVKAELDALWAAVNEHTHPVPGVTVGTGATTSSVPTSGVAGIPGTANAVSATKVKAK